MQPEQLGQGLFPGVNNGSGSFDGAQPRRQIYQ